MAFRLVKPVGGGRWQARRMRGNMKVETVKSQLLLHLIFVYVGASTGRAASKANTLYTSFTLTSAPNVNQSLAAGLRCLSPARGMVESVERALLG